LPNEARGVDRAVRRRVDHLQRQGARGGIEAERRAIGGAGRGVRREELQTLPGHGFRIARQPQHPVRKEEAFDTGPPDRRHIALAGGDTGQNEFFALRCKAGRNRQLGVDGECLCRGQLMGACSRGDVGDDKQCKKDKAWQSKTASLHSMSSALVHFSLRAGTKKSSVVRPRACATCTAWSTRPMSLSLWPSEPMLTLAPASRSRRMAASRGVARMPWISPATPCSRASPAIFLYQSRGKWTAAISRSTARRPSNVSPRVRTTSEGK